jgi:calcium-dependent protein kinase
MQASDMFSLGVMLFLLLSGRVPFGGSDNKQIKQNTLAGKYVWHANPPVSDSAKDLIAKLLCVNWRERITAAEALTHPWIENFQNNNVKLLEEAVRQQQQMGATRLIRKAIGGLLKKQGNETFLSQLQNVFASFDVDGDGKLDQGELREYMKASGYLRAEQAAEEFFQSEALEVLVSPSSAFHD